MKDNEVSFLCDTLELVAKHKRQILTATIAAVVVSASVSLIMPNTYKSTAKILPPQQDNSMMAVMISQMGGMASMASDLLGGTSPADMYVEVIKSESIRDALIDKFRLAEVYDEPRRVKLYKTMDKYIDVWAGKKDGIICISVVDEDPKRASAMANTMVNELDKQVIAMSTNAAAKSRVFYEDRLRQANEDLSKAKEHLRQFQEKNKILDLPNQAKASIEIMAQLKGQLAAAEAQLATLQKQFTDTEPEIRSAKAAVANLKGQITKLENDNQGAFPSVVGASKMGGEYTSIMQEVKTQEAIVELLTKQFQVNKLGEVNNVQTVKVIQSAKPADYKYGPFRALIVAGTTLVVFLLSLLYAYDKERACSGRTQSRMKAAIQRLFEWR